MNENYPPGTVAMVEGKVALRVDGPYNTRKTPTWQWGNGEWTALALGPIRPLVVLDLNEQSYRRVIEVLREKGLDQIADMIAEQTRPPKPDEPTGLGAVVEDEGRRWVHFGNACWIKTVPNANTHMKIWADFTPAVRVLSEGVVAP